MANGRVGLRGELGTRLESLRTDFASIKGEPFIHFYCPILFRDEGAELCKGHVLNQVFGLGADKWTVQRRDVDSFFGSRFESDLTKLRYRSALGKEDVLGKGRLRRELQPKIYAGRREVDFYIPTGEVPDHFTAVYATEAGLPPVIGLKIHAAELDQALDADWRIELSVDLRVGALVSLLKAAHLTQFFLFGYRYVLSPAGHLVGAQMLGKVFEGAEGLSKGEARLLAKGQLAGCENMVRPLLKTDLGLLGTALDGKLLVGWASSGFPWTTIVIVPAGDTLHGVMLPVGDHVEAIATWYSFMTNDNESIAVKLARFDPETDGGVWSLSVNTWRIRWPKGATMA